MREHVKKVNRRPSDPPAKHKAKTIMMTRYLNRGMEWLDAVRLTIALAICVFASYTDWKTRTASDMNWVAMGGAGLVLLAIELLSLGADWTYFFMLFPVGFVFFDLFWDRRELFEGGVNWTPLALYGLSLAVIAFMLVQHNQELLYYKLVTILVVILIMILLYQFDVIKGGADAKALIALAVLMPAYPIIGQLPLIHMANDWVSIIFPFALLVLFYAALLTIFIPPGLFFYNLYRHDVKMPAMLLGYRLSIAEARGKFVWPMESIKEGKRRFTYFPKDEETGEAALKQLEEAGADMIWVTPKLPFLVPITGAVLTAAVIGNLFLAFMR